MTEARVFRLALRDLHASAGATFAQHGEWSLPEHYGDAAADYAALRTHAAAFDRSHTSRILVTGTDAAAVLESAFVAPLELEEGRARRALALDSAGHVRDIVLIARTAGIAYLVSGAPARRDETLARLRAAVGPDFDVRIDDRTESTCSIALAGPGVASVAEAHLARGLPARLAPLGCLAFEFHGFRALVTRTSETGEEGYELMVAPAVAQHLLETLTSAGIPLAGFASTESARVESCIPAVSPDLETGLSPAEADLAGLVGLDGPAPRRILAAALVEGPPLPPGTRIRVAGRDVGEIRSCLHSYALDATIALAVVDSATALPGTRLDLGAIPGTIVSKPFYRRRS